MKNQWRPLMWLVIFALTTSTLKSQELVIRKNIDDLTAVELKTYEHAIQILKDRSDVNPYDKTGYAWQAWVHNSSYLEYPKSEENQRKFNREAFEKEIDKENKIKNQDNPKTDRAYYEWALKRHRHKKTYAQIPDINWIVGVPGKCEHGKDLFLTWHRAQFYYFEEILKRANPEGEIRDSKGNAYSTKQLAVPFWNYTQRATGSRYPKAFERRNSALFHKYREWVPVESAPLSKVEFSAILSQEWEIFGGYGLTRGVFEMKMHDYMHGGFVGGGGEPLYDKLKPSMFSTSTAAYDPIFYSFHAYIDYALDFWIEKNGTKSITGKESGLRSEQHPSYHLPGHVQPKKGTPNMGVVNLYLSSEKLGYKYSIKEADKPYDAQQRLELATDSNGERLRYGISNISPFYQLYTYKSHIRPFASPNQVDIREGVVPNGEYKVTARPNTKIGGSYQVDVYITPSDVKLDIQSHEFRQKYLADWGAKWVDSEGSDASGTQVSIDIARALNEMAKNLGKRKFNIITAITEY